MSKDKPKNGSRNSPKNLPGDRQQRRQGRKMLEWLRQELGLSGNSPQWHESNLFWGSLGIGGALVLTAATANGMLWLLAPAWLFFCSACWAAFRGIRSRKIRWGLFASFSIVIAAGLVFVGIWKKPAIVHDTFMQPSSIGIPRDYLPLLTPNKVTGFNIGFFNGGQYPAHNVFSGSALKVANVLSRDMGRSMSKQFKQDFWDMIKSTGINGITIDPGNRKWGTSSVFLTDKDVDEIYAGRKFVYLLGYAQWDSSTGKEENAMCFVLQTPEHRPLEPQEVVWRTCEAQLQVLPHK